MIDLGALFLAGLALFFTGLAGVKSNLQQLSSRRFRRMLAGVTNRPPLAVAVGALFGAVTQSASAVAFILAGMITTGLLQIRQALPVLAASNLGTAVLVFLAAINIKVAILYLIGVTGLAIAFDVGGSRAKPAFSAFFSIGLLFYGLDLMKAAFGPLPSFPWFSDLAAFLTSFGFAPFFLGLSLRVLIQSSSAISVIAITLVQGGLFNEFQAGMLMAGTGPGVGLATYLLSSNLSGVSRQIVLYQSIINVVSGTLIAALLAAEEYLNVPGIESLTRMLCAAEVDTRLALVFLILMVCAFVVGILILPFSPRWLEHLAPPTIQEDLGKPQFLVDEAVELPDTALDLADKEQARFLEYLPRFLDPLLPAGERKEAPEAESLHGGCQSLHREIVAFLRELSRHAQEEEASQRLLRMERRQENLATLAKSVYQFAGIVKGCQSPPALAALATRLLESLHTMLLTLAEAVQQGNPLDIEFLHTMTEDRCELMERLRKSYLDNPEVQTFADRSTLYYATSLFERIVWLIHQIVSGLRQET